MEDEKHAGPEKGEFITSQEVSDADEEPEALPSQEDFWQPPVRFGNVPVEKEPLGWDRRSGFRKLFPQVMLPIQVVERVSFGHPDLEPNRLFWGDNLHVMRQLPSESIDLIYLDPPFFSGKQYNVIFGDQNELRSFSDIWEGGMPGYLIWLNARLYEMKRLLKKTGSIYVHCDWHASHYIKVEMDKIFGYDNFRNEIVWTYSGGGIPKRDLPRKHDVLFRYAKTPDWKFNTIYREYNELTSKRMQYIHKGIMVDTERGTPITDWWTDIKVPTGPRNVEKVGYPTQKPVELVGRIIEISSDPGDVVADFFCGGGTSVVAAAGMRKVDGELIYDPSLARRWIGCDISRVAVAITADRISQLVEYENERLFAEESTGKSLDSFPVADITIEHWGVYEADRLSETPPAQFREFVLRAFGAKPDGSQTGIHGVKGAVPIWVGEPDQRSQVTAKDVEMFANAIRKTARYQQDNLREGVVLAWAFRPDAVEAAEQLREMEQTDINFIRLDIVRIDSPRFREIVSALSTDHADYENFLTFVQPPHVEVGFKRIAARTYIFDVSETVVLNAGAEIINVQWDFDYNERFGSTRGYSFVRGKKKEPALQAQYEFPRKGTSRIACKVQDDMGGEGLWTGEVEVT